jgi:hypothetical protein
MSTPVELPERHNLRWMAAGALLALLAVGVVLLVRHDAGGSSSDVIRGSGVTAAQARHVSAFTGIELAGSNNVIVRVGGRRSVVVRADDNLLGRVTTRVHVGNLVVGTEGSFTTRGPMSVEVTVPSLTAVALTGSGNVVVSGVHAQTLNVTLPGSGVVRASGVADRLRVRVGGAGDVQLDQLVARDVSAVVSGSGRVLVTATRSLDASVPGSGAILYGGDPTRVVTSVTGSGAIIRT